MIVLVSFVESRDWINGNIEYIRGLTNTGYTLNKEVISEGRDSFSAEISHGFKFLPNGKFTMYNDKDNLKVMDTTIFYSMLQKYGYFQMGWNFKSVNMNGDKEELSNGFLRYKTREIRKTSISYTYNYKPSEVKEHVVDLNYKLIRGVPLMIGFQYKRSNYRLKKGDINIDGLFLKAGLTF